MARPGQVVDDDGGAAHQLVAMEGDQAVQATLLDGLHPGRDDLGMADVATHEQQVVGRQGLDEGGERRTIRSGHQAQFHRRVGERHAARIFAKYGLVHTERFPSH
ncbi:hypothetical protein D3C76_622760 [compost metagenome]